MISHLASARFGGQNGFETLMDWWIWILFGLLLLLVELVTPGGFYILFFGIGAVIVGILVAFESAGPA